MSAQFLLQVGLAGLVLSAAAYLGTKAHLDTETPVGRAMRTTLLASVAIFLILCVVPHFSSDATFRIYMGNVAGTLEHCADRWLGLR